MSASAEAPATIAFEPLIADGPHRYAVKLPIFEGPLDLLLHLIRINEVDIHDIPVARIAEQYVGYLELMRELNLEIAGEYLLMAATLAWIKSRMLLPREEEEETEPVDPRAELVARLLEYQAFKEAAGELDGRPRLGRDVFRAEVAASEGLEPPEPELAVRVLDLVEAYRRVVEKQSEPPAPHALLHEPVTVRECMVAVMAHLEREEVVDFEDLLAAGEGRGGRRAWIVATFLAVLELARWAALRLYQGVDEEGVPTGSIHVRRGPEAEAGHWRDAISEIM